MPQALSVSTDFYEIAKIRHSSKAFCFSSSDPGNSKMISQALFTGSGVSEVGFAVDTVVTLLVRCAVVLVVVVVDGIGFGVVGRGVVVDLMRWVVLGDCEIVLVGAIVGGVKGIVNVSGRRVVVVVGGAVLAVVVDDVDSVGVVVPALGVDFGESGQLECPEMISKINKIMVLTRFVPPIVCSADAWILVTKISNDENRADMKSKVKGGKII